MHRFTFLIAAGLACNVGLARESSESLPVPVPPIAEMKVVPAPKPHGVMLRAGDRVAICGDSITEQKMYSRLMEDYLTMCLPELHVTVRQYGWSGERAPGFLARMTNDCLRFHPTVATTCYGMNDHEYKPYEPRIGRTYIENTAKIVEAFKANGVRVILGSPGCVGKIPSWVKSASGTVADLNTSLCTLRNIDAELADEEHVGFADVFWPMYRSGLKGQSLYGTNYAIAGKDGVHPDWAGQTIMAYAFLKAMGVPGDIGTLNVDLKRGTAKASKGHAVITAQAGRYEFESSRYPFCPCLEQGQATANYPVCGKDDLSRENSIRSAMTLVYFNEELNKLMLKASGMKAERYEVTWGDQKKVFSAVQLKRGINLALEFPCNPFCEQFAKVDAAVAAKQAFETKQIKQVFHGAEGKRDMAAAVSSTEQDREPLAKAIQYAFKPVRHVIEIRAL